MDRVRELWGVLRDFPWGHTLAVFRERLREDHLSLSASSLTFTTTIALVPLVTVALAVFTAFPVFAKLQGALQQWLVASLVPESIARQVDGYLRQFAGKASELGAAGAAALLFSALTLVFTIDRTLNGIWRTRQPRPFGQRVLLYWAALTLGPLLVALSLALTSYALSASAGWLPGGLPWLLRALLATVEYVALSAGFAMLYRFVPNARVDPRHALAGGLLAAALIELGKKGLTVYIGAVPTYSAVYGAFAALPIMLLWIYLAWLFVLFGAVLAAHLPTLMMGSVRRGGKPGWSFQLALELLPHLEHARSQSAIKGLSARTLAWRLKTDPLDLRPVLEALTALDWVGELVPARAGAAARYVLLVPLSEVTVQPLAQRLLLAEDAATADFARRSGWPSMAMGDVLASPVDA